MSRVGPASGTQPPNFDNIAAGSRAGQILTEGSPGPLLSREQRQAEARLWLDEFADFSQAGRLRLAMREAGGEWSELRGFRPGCGPYRDADREALLDSLAASVVNLSDRRADVFCSPYPHARNRSKGGATARLHVHADVDGPLNMAAVRGLGAMAVTSGSLAEDGSPRGHVYVRLSESVDPDTHRALCRGLGQAGGGEHADGSKVSDEDVLRPAGTLNHKGEAPGVVRWLVRPDDPGVRTWEPAELARVLEVSWPVVSVPPSSTEAIDPVKSVELETVGEPAAQAAKTDAGAGRLEGLLRAVREAPKGKGNSRLNWAAGKASALGAPEAFRSELVAAFLSRPVPVGESVVSRRSEAAGTVSSGWRWGMSHPDDASAVSGAGRSRGEVLESAAGAGEDVGDLEARLVHDELRKLRVRDVARALYDAEKTPPAEPFDLDTLTAVLARPAPPRARVEQLVPWEASTLVVAQRKTGKTTLALNLARCLLTGEPFLGTLDVRPVEGRVALFNFEVAGATVARWAHDAGVPGDRFILASMRGRRNPFSNRADRAGLAQALRSRGVETLIVDPFGRAYAGVSQNDAGEVGAWLVDLDRFARAEVGAKDLILTAHAGWNGERSRGSSALEDWADSIVNLTKDEDGRRFLSAIGRDVDLEEDRLDFDHHTRTLTLSGAGSRRTAAKERHLDDLAVAILATVNVAPGLNGSELARRLKADGVSFQKGDEAKAYAQLVDAGKLRVETGPRGSKCYYLPDLPRPAPTYPDGVRTDLPRPPLIGRGRSGGTSDQSPTPDGLPASTPEAVTGDGGTGGGQAAAPSDAAPASPPQSPRTRATSQRRRASDPHGEDRA